jgi:hypothetical protein
MMFALFDTLAETKAVVAAIDTGEGLPKLGVAESPSGPQGYVTWHHMLPLVDRTATRLALPLDDISTPYIPAGTEIVESLPEDW